MQVSVVLADATACGTYRLIWPAQAVKRVRPDWQINLHPPGSVQMYTTPDGRLGRLTGMPPLGEIDVMLVQRVGQPVQIDLMRKAQTAGCAAVLENDDAMWCIDPANAAHRDWNSRQYHWRNTDAAAAVADLCTVTTPVLARRYGDGRAVVLPNCVPQLVLDTVDITRPDRTPVVGWTGHIATHPRDLLVVGDAVRRASGITVAAMPDAEGVAQAWGLDHVERIEPAKLGAAYYQALTGFDIALVPLQDTKFNRAKSALKALECSAVGCVVVASPTPANVALERSGVPLLLAATPQEWHEHITRLAGDPDERRQRVEVARKVISEQWTYEANAEAWAQAWERAANRRKMLAS